MAERLNCNKELRGTLIPKWELGCRRITPGPEYLESFLRPNCHIVNSFITRVSENSVHTEDGKVYECDVIVCASGFDVSHRPRFPLVGLNNIDLREKWAEDPEPYISVAVPEIPNYFMMMGPNCLGGHVSLVGSLNWTGDYIVRWVRKLASEDIKYVAPKKEKVDAFLKYSDETHKTLVWTGGAHLFSRLLGEIRGEDFDIVYNTANPFRFMGHGFTKFEMDPDSDLAWYVEKAETLGNAV